MPEIPTQPQPTSNQKSINWKRVLIITVIAVVVIGLGEIVYRVLQPKEETTTAVTAKKATPSAKISTPSVKKDETEGWKIVTNNKMGYSIKYPVSWATYRCEGNPVDYFVASEEPVSPKLKICGTGATAPVTIYKGKTLTEEVIQWDKVGQKEYSNYKKEYTTVGTRTVVKIYAVSKENLPAIQEGVIFINYILDDPQGALVIKYIQFPPTEVVPTRPDYTDILEKMLSTAKFLD